MDAAPAASIGRKGISCCAKNAQSLLRLDRWLKEGPCCIHRNRVCQDLAAVFGIFRNAIPAARRGRSVFQKDYILWKQKRCIGNKGIPRRVRSAVQIAKKAVCIAVGVNPEAREVWGCGPEKMRASDSGQLHVTA